MSRPSPQSSHRTSRGAAGLAVALFAAAVLPSALLLGGCGVLPEERRGPPDVVLVLVDTLRADHLALYGYHRPTNPELARFARRAVRFETVQAQAGCTFPSVNSLLTSRYPFHFLGQPEERRHWIPRHVPSLPEVLAAHGYSTAAVSASPIVRATPSDLNPSGGYGRGFDVFDESCFKEPARCLNRRAFELLDGMERPAFLYLHYMEPHARYQPPPEHRRRFAVDGSSKPWVERGDPLPIIYTRYQGVEHFEVTERDVAQMVDLYDEEIVYFDDQFGELLAGLEERGRLENTLIAVASDHGEAWLEHGIEEGEYGHCRDIAFQSVMATPLLLRLPGEGPSGVRRARVQNLDLVPTLLDYLGVPADGLGLEGKSLRPVIEEDRNVNRYLFALAGTTRSVRGDRFKLIYDLRSETSRLFDLRADPGETRDVLAEHPDEAEALRRALFRWIEAIEGRVGAAESLQKTDELERRLKAVGYL